MKEPLVFYCQITYADEYENTKKCVDLVAPYVDYVILVVEKQRPFTEEQKKELLKHRNVIILEREWRDNFPESRNYYIEEAKKIARELNALDRSWLLVSDSDEFFCDQFLKDLRQIIQYLEENNLDSAQLCCRERFDVVEWLDDLDLLKEAPWRARDSDYYKMLLVKLYPDLRYVGVGISKTVHESFNRPHWNVGRLDKNKYWYEHVKSCAKIWRNAARNVFCGGGGSNVGILNPYWKPLLDLCKKHGINSWPEFERALENGLPKEIEDFIMQFLDIPPTDWGVECRQLVKYYLFLHPEKITPELEEKLKNPPKMTPEIEVENKIMQIYFEVFGRHPDKPGLEYWKWMVLEGRVKLEDLPRIFMESEEYKRLQMSKGELVRVEVPVDVRVQVTEDLFEKALMQSDLWWKRIKPALDIGRFVIENLGSSFVEWFYRERELGNLTIEKFAEELRKLCK